MKLNPDEVSGLILAGGAGRRMGGIDKGWALFNNRPLVEHVVARLRPQVGHLMISANRNQERYAALGAAVVSDLRPDYPGPLAGMEAGLAASPSPYLLCCPCDAPLLPTNLLARLCARLPDGKAAAATVAGRWQPVFCLLPRSSLGALSEVLDAGERRVIRALEQIGAHPVPFDDAAEAFANLNTAAALHTAEPPQQQQPPLPI